MVGQYHKSVLAVQNKWKGEMNLIFTYAYNYNLDLNICILYLSSHGLYVLHYGTVNSGC